MIMAASLQLLGIIFAIVSGITNNIGNVMQKKVVNEVNRNSDTNAKFFKSLVRNPLWLTGLVLQMAIGAVFFMLAQLWIGPALIPGLMAVGLVFLAIGSVKIVGETLKTPEIIGILIMIVGITLLGFSELFIDIANFNMLETGFLWRLSLFTVALTLISILLFVLSKKIERYQPILLAILSGFMFAISNYWISPLMGVIAKVFAGQFMAGELILFIAASIILPLTNVIGIGVLQRAYTRGQASNLIPIQQVPIQILPILIYFAVFLFPAPSDLSILLAIVSVVLIIGSSFLLGQRQAMIENIK
jgi:protein-S-isoprenylcysteine O-methyltransferase Ste14